MKRKQKLMMLAGVLLVLVVVVRVLPGLYAHYQRGQEEIALLEERVERYRNLILDSDLWLERAELKAAEIGDLQDWVFEGANPNLTGSSVQRLLRQAMEQANLRVMETSVARYTYIEDWLMVSQDMNFALDQNQILPFLNALQQIRPRLYVTAFSVTRNRRQFTGSITVAGFSRAR
jgi:hypothetical protein